MTSDLTPKPAEPETNQIVETEQCWCGCALFGGETAVDMEIFGGSKEKFLRHFLELPHRIPCHMANSLLFRIFDPDSILVLLQVPQKSCRSIQSKSGHGDQ